MKKVLSIIMLIAVTTIAFNVSAQSSKITGTWIGNSIDMSESGIKVETIPVVTFSSNGTGLYGCSMMFNGQVPGMNLNMDITFTGTAPCKWNLDGSTLYINTECHNFKIDVKEINLTSSDPQIQAALEQNKGQFAEMFKAEFQKQLNKQVNETEVWENVTVSGDTMTAVDADGETMTFSRF